MSPEISPEMGPGTGPEVDLSCGHCGEPAAARNHDACAERLRMEPPRFCVHCRRRMQVQVTPTSWSARCVEHGTLSSP